MNSGVTASRSVVLIVDEGDILRWRSDVVLELSKADVADFKLADFHWYRLYIHMYKTFLYIASYSD